MDTPRIEPVQLGDLQAWRVRVGDAELLIAAQGAQVLSYRRSAEPPLIWLSEQASYRSGQPVRGGVPVCWPWFGDLGRNPAEVQALHPNAANAPAHGLVRDLDWQLLGSEYEPAAASLSFACPRPANGLPGWPAGLELRLDVRLDQRLSLRLTSHNRSAQPVTLSQALHTYFAISDIHQVRVEGLDGTPYVETLEDWAERHQQGPLRFTGETDRIYLEVPARLDLADPQWQRRIVLETLGSASAVLWNPWIDKARRLSQFADDAWPQMLCIETANVLGDTVHLAPGQQHTLGLSIWSEPL